jgi:hypothetical protein
MQASTHLIPRIELQFSDVKRQQLPVVWLPSMSVNKAQGQTSNGHASRMGPYFYHPSFNVLCFPRFLRLRVNGKP